MKRIRVLGCLLILLLCGCAAAPVCAEDQGESHYYAVCETYTGRRGCTLTVGDNACLSLQCAVERRGGRLDLSITDGTGAEVHRSEGLAEDTGFVVRLTEPGTYTVVIDAADYTGDVRLDWEAVGAAAQ